MGTGRPKGGRSSRGREASALSRLMYTVAEFPTSWSPSWTSFRAS